MKLEFQYSFQAILDKYLGMRRDADEQKEHRPITSTYLFRSLESDTDFLKSITTDDET